MSGRGHTGNTPDLASALARLTALEDRVSAQAQVIKSLEGLAPMVARLAQRGPGGAGDGYEPEPSLLWHALDEAGRAEALARLREWVSGVYTPCWGHLGTVPACWESHPLCLQVLDIVSELWAVLYDGERSYGILSAQAELATRIMPAAAALLRQEAARCTHRAEAFGPRPGQLAGGGRRG